MTTQVLLISQSGFILKSAGNLLPGHWLLHNCARKTFPLVESIWPELQGLRPESPGLQLECVAQPHPLLLGFYSFSFRQTGGPHKHLELSIHCRTRQAIRYRRRAQQRNESEL